MATKNRSIALLVMGAFSLLTTGRLFAAEIRGTVREATGNTATVVAEGDVVPNAGDSATIFFKLPGADDEVLVANGKVTGVAGDSVTVKIDDAKGKVEKDQLARITSANPKPKSAPVAASPPTPPSPSPQWTAEVQSKFDHGDYDGAIATLTKAIEANPNDATAYYQRAACYGSKQAWDNAIADADRALTLGYGLPGYAYTVRGAGYSGKGNFKAAMEDLTKAIALSPNYARAYVLRAEAGIRLGDWKNVLEDCNKALALDPTDAGAYLDRGYYYSHVGATEAAEADWKKAIAIEPTNEKRVDTFRKTYAPKKNSSRKR